MSDHNFYPCTQRYRTSDASLPTQINICRLFPILQWHHDLPGAMQDSSTNAQPDTQGEPPAYSDVPERADLVPVFAQNVLV